MEHTANLRPELTPDQELAYIRKIMADSRRAFAEDGKPYVVWGLIVSIGMTVTYISALLDRDLYSGYVWIGLVLLGYANIFFYVRKKKREEPRVKSVLDRIQAAIWGAVGGSIGLVILLIFLGSMIDTGVSSISGLFICFITAILTGIGFFLSGIALDLKWLRNVGFAWWAGSIVMYLWPSVHILGLYALMMLLFQVVPGIALNHKYRADLSHAALEA
ncbi:MAG: hypothetical protein Q8922_00760 [Bacteroidota bacterium]|nr:hypothetical protein [Bacteroidota bacterium]MDP4232562.1 hypothetical protein [Bacteroidota bacterium]MDP4242983.1 hypothetical protein [Bacteroidota bacterium]MDP4286442.1 hypothetical protein [Bacteroidota bacterium]